MPFDFGESFCQEASYMVLGLILPLQVAVAVSCYVATCQGKPSQNSNLFS